MSYQHLKDIGWYEDVYDRGTVSSGRRHIVYYDDFYDEFEKKLPADDKISRPGNAFLLNVFYMQTVGNELIRRYQDRDQTIEQWMAKDEAKDDQIATARLTKEPKCQHCGKQGLRITDKSLMHRGDTYKHDDAEEVLFMLSCPHCDKNSAVWEDGTAFKLKPTLCPKCSTEMIHETTKTRKAIIFVYSCPSCKHSYKDMMNLGDKKDEPDPDYDKDRAHYCLEDKDFRDRLIKMKNDFEEMARLGKKFKEKEDNKHIYDAIKELKKPKIAELSSILAPTLEKSGFIEFHLDQPNMNRMVSVGFNCLDSKSRREDYESRKTLQKLIRTTLEDTNWRLTSDGISYRLGYLNGTVRAYEDEEDMKKLVIKSGKVKPKPQEDSDNKKKWTIEGKDGEEIIL